MNLFKKSTKNETQYPFYSIHMAFTRDGSFMQPFVVNISKTAIKDMETGKIVTIPNREADSKKELTPDELLPALQELYGKPNILCDNLGSLLHNITPSHEVVPGKAFDTLNTALRKHDINYSRKDILTDDNGPYSAWRKELCTYSGLKMAIGHAKYRLKEEYKQQQKQEDRRQRQQEYNERVAEVSRDSLDF